MSVTPQGFPDDPMQRVTGYSARDLSGDVRATLKCGHQVVVHGPMPPRELRCRQCGDEREAAAS